MFPRSTNTNTILNINLFHVDLDVIQKKSILLKEYLDKIGSLPEAVHKLFFAHDTSNILESIAIDYTLTHEQVAEMTRIVRDTLLTDLYLADMPKHVTQRLHVDEHTAQEIASRIFNDVFEPAMETIKKMHLEKFSRSTTTTKQTDENVVDLRQST